MLSGGYTQLSPAPSAELCRRMGLDFTGSIPTPDEAARICSGHSAAEMAATFMAQPSFLAREQRLWFLHLRTHPGKVFAPYLLEGDAIVARLARGEIGYDTFATQLVAHPVVATNKPPQADEGDDGKDYTAVVASEAIRVFLGRMPVGGEADDFSHLFRVWTRDSVPDPELMSSMVERWEPVLDPAPCRDPVLGAQACTSSMLGPSTTVSLPMLSARAPWASFMGAPPDDVRRELEKPGRLLTMRTEFWDEAADHALARFLGWWKSSKAQPDTDLPEVRAALSTWFRQTGDHDLRRLYTMIVTSILYTQSNERADGPDTLPPWAMGPSKPMLPEQWLDSVSKALARPLGFCDIHTDEPIGSNYYFPDRFRRPQPADFYGFGYDYYFYVAQQLGGCSVGREPAVAPGLPTLFAQNDASQLLCAAPSVIAPAAYDFNDASAGNLSRLVDFQLLSMLGRAAAPDETSAITQTAASCLPNQSCGLSLFASELCSATLRSGAFLYY